MHSPSLLLLTSPPKTPILLSGTPDCRVLILLYSCERTEHAYPTLTGSGSNPQFLTFTRSMDVRWGFHMFAPKHCFLVYLSSWAYLSLQCSAPVTGASQILIQHTTNEPPDTTAPGLCFLSPRVFFKLLQGIATGLLRPSKMTCCPATTTAATNPCTRVDAGVH